MYHRICKSHFNLLRLQFNCGHDGKYCWVICRGDETFSCSVALVSGFPTTTSATTCTHWPTYIRYMQCCAVVLVCYCSQCTPLQLLFSYFLDKLENATTKTTSRFSCNNSTHEEKLKTLLIFVAVGRMGNQIITTQLHTVHNSSLTWI